MRIRPPCCPPGSSQWRWRQGTVQHCLGQIAGHRQDHWQGYGALLLAFVRCVVARWGSFVGLSWSAIFFSGGSTIKAIQAKSGARLNISKQPSGEWTSIEIIGQPQMVTSVKMQIEKITGSKLG